MKKNSRVTRAAVTAAVVAALSIGAAAPVATAQIKPVLPDFGSLMPGMAQSNAPKTRLGETGGLLWKGEMFKQVTRGATVTPGGLVTTRLEVRGMTNRGEKVRELADIMPAGFELVSVTRMKENALGEALHIVPAEDYTVAPAANGMQEVRISWTEGGFLGLFQDNPDVSTTKSIMVDFTYRAPKDHGRYQHGGYFRMGSAIAPEFRTDTGGTPITVDNSANAIFGSLGSS